MALGMLGGVYAYRQYAHERMQKFRFHGFCGVPYQLSSIDNREMALMNSKYRDESDDIFFDPSVDIYK